MENWSRMRRTNPLTLITSERVRELEIDVGELEHLKENLSRWIYDEIPLPTGYPAQVAATLARINDRLATIRPGLAHFPWTREFLDIVLKSNKRGLKLNIEMGTREIRIWATAIVLLHSQLDVGSVYLHRLLEMLPRNVKLAEETKLFWEQWTTSRLHELPTRERRWFYIWTAIGLYGIATLAVTYAAVWFPILFRILPSFLFPLVLTSQGLQAYPGILPPGLGYSSLVVLAVIFATEIRALYGFVNIQ